MYRLFIDTHDSFIVYGLFLDRKLVASKKTESGRRHGDTAMPLLKELLSEASIDIHSIEEILVVTGPGSFTGVRIGVTIAKMLAYTLNKHIKTITSLEMYALNFKDEQLVLKIDDQKGSYFGNFDNSKLIGELSYLSKDEFAKYAVDKNVKNGEVIDFPELIEYFIAQEPVDVHAVKPIYIKVIEALK